MNTSGEAAEQIVRMSLEGFEVAARITGAGAKNIAILLYSILKEEKKTKGKARLTNMLRSGKELKVFTVKNGDLKKFTQEAQTVVARRGQHLDHAVVDFQNGDIERAAAEVIDHDLLCLLLVDAVGQRGGRRLVDDTLDVQTRDLAGVLRRLTLRVGEVGGDGDDGLADGRAQIALGVALQLLQDHGADLLRGVALAVDGDLVVGAHLTLDRGDGALGVGDGLALGDLTDHTLAGLGERDHGRGGAIALCVGDNDCLAALHDGHAGIGGTQINTDNLRHNDCLLKDI